MTVKNTDLNSFTGQVCLTYYNMSSNPYDFVTSLKFNL